MSVLTYQKKAMPVPLYYLVYRGGGKTHKAVVKPVDLDNGVVSDEDGDGLMRFLLLNNNYFKIAFDQLIEVVPFTGSSHHEKGRIEGRA